MKRDIRRTMMFLNAQKASLVKDPYVYGADCVILDLEDAVSASEKDSARIHLYHTLKSRDYGDTEVWVRVNDVYSDLFVEDVRAAVAGGADGIRIPMTETRDHVIKTEAEIEKAEKDFGREVGSTMIMAALESPLGVLNAYEIASASKRMMGIALSAGDFRRTMHAQTTATGEELFTARGMIAMAARAAGIMCFDTVYTDLDNIEGLRRETELIKNLGYDGKSVVNPRQIEIIHDVFTPSEKDIREAEHIVLAVEESKKKGIGVMVVDGKMVDIAHVEGARRNLKLAKVAGKYKGDLA
ncbi:aldolase/citrate lyase family protein [Peptoniphilus equinus]|uniref:Aldolase/citrate lyase family protein n=1 Tax=Peptoniphilus equinus TaxID=3016343 RepID=A0ABY7QT69_9FIRM|nr:aldolase/citrate lyase family protein [Peptoniphilus equinus]WBW49661.1 aldolase/citrate lyase family protein [Peptoniphilus equinus]